MFLKDHVREAIDAREHQAMQMISAIGGGAKPLDEGDGTGLGLGARHLKSVPDDGCRCSHDPFTLFTPANIQVTCNGFSR